MNGSLQPPTDGHGWLDLFDRIASAQWPLTTFVLILFALTAYLLWSFMRDMDKRHQDACEETRLELLGRHKVCEWKLQQITKAMMLHIKANNSGKRSNQGRRDTDKLVGDMLEAALRGPETDADRAEVNAMPV